MKGNVLEYKGYHARIEYDAEDCVLYGKIEGINDLVNFESDSLDMIEDEFHNAVDDYLLFCKEVGKNPDKEYKGSFNVRIQAEDHRNLAVLAELENTSLNSMVEKAVRALLERSRKDPVVNTVIFGNAKSKTITTKYPKQGSGNVVWMQVGHYHYGG